MRKTKKLKKNIKTLCLFAIVQLILGLIWALAIHQEKLAGESNTQTLTFYADEVEQKDLFVRPGAGDTSIIISFDSVEYVYDLGVSRYQDEHSIEGLQASLSQEKLVVTYRKVLDIFKTYNQIVEIRSENTVYYTMEDFNSVQTKELILAILLLSFIEIIYLFILFFYLFLYIEADLPFFPNAKKESG